jgi:hypothetical protein
MTIEAWVNPRTLSAWRTVLLKESPTGLAYALYANDNAPRAAGYVRLAGGAADQEVPGTAPVPLNAWTHLAATFDGGTLKLFVNGIRVNSVPLSGNIGTSAAALQIGGNTVWGEYFDGVIDEVRVYRRALNASEIQVDMNTPVP